MVVPLLLRVVTFIGRCFSFRLTLSQGQALAKFQLVSTTSVLVTDFVHNGTNDMRSASAQRPVFQGMRRKPRGIGRFTLVQQREFEPVEEGLAIDLDLPAEIAP